MTRCRILVLALLAATLALAAPAGASDGSEYFGPAATYWGSAPSCERITIIRDESKMQGMRARAEQPGCTIWTGDDFAASTPTEKCSTVVHEYGHLLGHGHDHAADRDQVMIYRWDHLGRAYTRTPVMCAQPDPPVVLGPEWAYLDAVERRTRALERRADCRSAARRKRIKRARTRARLRCARIVVPLAPTRP